MNRKFILLFSLLIVAVGVAGILNNNKDDTNNLTNFGEQKKEQNVDILLAQAIRPLPSGKILTSEDYELTKIMVSKSSELINSDVSNIKMINSHLLKSNITAGSYITNDMLVSPDSREFSQLTLKNNELIYRFNITQEEAYLLDALSIGDMIVLQLRTRETDKRKGLENSINIDTNELNDRKPQNYLLTNVISNIQVIRIKKHSSSDLSEKNKGNQKTDEIFTGYIDVIIRTDELDLIHMAEKAGDILLVPEVRLGNHSYSPISLHDIFPKLHTVRELRG
ncbi:putative tight adherance operon protein [Yersinia intermedia]|uniref:Putative tight adherance operon protein n=1 Tax=Yersinia intermedia TaxID=631 RepID=A0A0H5MJ85_YERIN|nr:tight adherance operon protein [Yersinia intermedia]CRY57186.1 putative tight adherance operon protein [Yersinia intermedia]